MQAVSVPLMFHLSIDWINLAANQWVVGNLPFFPLPNSHTSWNCVQEKLDKKDDKFPFACASLNQSVTYFERYTVQNPISPKWNATPSKMLSDHTAVAFL